ncbi:MAG: hypothetical protein NT087_10135 [Deltaproteobacteria bacterium]|nr:hypothetical protein [Deltaproteobacteria bacterium]
MDSHTGARNARITIDPRRTRGFLAIPTIKAVQNSRMLDDLILACSTLQEGARGIMGPTS